VDLYQASTVFTLFAYLTAAIITLKGLFTEKGPNLPLVLTAAILGIATHSYALTHSIISHNHLNFSLPNVITLVCLLITATVTIVAMRFKIHLLLPVTYGFSVLWQLLLLFIPNVDHTLLSTMTLVTATHIIISLVAYCILVIATLYVFQVKYINSRLKGKELSSITHLPPLMQVERQLFLILTLGTCALFISQLIGFLFLDSYFALIHLHKTILSLIALSIFSVTLWGHFQLGWRGHKVLTLITSGTVLLTLAYFGSRFVKEFLLS